MTSHSAERLETATGPHDHHGATRRALTTALAHQRQLTERLLAPLTPAEVHEQRHDFLSPIIWDVGHVGNFEELWLLRNLDGRPAMDPALDELYNAFENPRWVRGELPILPADAAWPYLRAVRAEVLALLARLDLGPDADPRTADGCVHRMIAQHESQHQETILQSLDLREHVSAWDLGTPTRAMKVDDRRRVTVDAGTFPLGTDERRWTYDNERPSHERFVDAFDIDVHPVTCRRYAAFVDDGGYTQTEHWSAEGRTWLAETGHQAPQGWLRVDGAWKVRRIGQVIPLDPYEPVQHVCFHEAEAFASWAGGTLPTEVQWEKAASWDPATQTKRRFPWGDDAPDATLANVGLRRSGPSPIGSHPIGASAYGVEGMAGDVYEWTTSPFEPWPDFTAFPYDEYSKVFFGGDYRVLRGSSWAIADPMARCTYRNWDHPYRRQIFAGIRLVWPVGQDAKTREDR